MAFKSLSGKDDGLVAENYALRTHASELAQKVTGLIKDKEKLADELRVERFQASVRVRKARQYRNKILELESAAKQRDSFIHAMIDVNLHQHVLKDAYFTVEAGRSVDEALVEAIQFAASKPASPWSRIFAQQDVTKSDIYKCAIELAAAARLRTDRSIRVASFWKHIAKKDNRNSDIITPSTSTLENMDDDLEKDERRNMLDGLLERLHAGEDVRTKKAESTTLTVQPDSPLGAQTASTFFEFHRPKTGRVLQSRLSHTALASWDSDFMIGFATGKPQKHVSVGDAEEVSACPTPTSLDRICGVFTEPSHTNALNASWASSALTLSHLHDSLQLSHLHDSLQPTSFIPGRGRSATVPCSARDLTIPLVKNVVSRIPVIIAPGDNQQDVLALAGHKVRFNDGASLVRSKAITTRRTRYSNQDRTTSPVRKVLSEAFTPTESPAFNASNVLSLVQNKAGLPTPPEEADSIRYVRPPTVTRKKGSRPPSLGKSAPSVLYNVPSRSSFDSTSSSPTQQRIRRYVVKTPSPPHSEVAPPRLSPSPLSSRVKISRLVASGTTPRRRPAHSSEKQPNSPPKAKGTSESDKENAPPRTRPLTPIKPRVPKLRTLRIPTQTTPSDNSHRDYGRRIPRSPTRASLAKVKPVLPGLKTVQPLRIIKKNPAQKRPPVTSVSPTHRASGKNRTLPQ